MIAFLLSWVLAAHACDLPASVALLQTVGDKDAYLCVAAESGGAEAVTAALDAMVGPPETLADARGRYTRAIALWLLQRTDTTWDPALVRRLSADDRRLLADGVYARRGRASPAPAHDTVFKNLSWYAPDPNYTDGKLSAADREKIALADKPPPAPATAVDLSGDAAIDALSEGEAAAPSSAISGICGCASAPSGVWSGAAVLGLLFVFGRRRR
jgi:hypothetical protein